MLRDAFIGLTPGVFIPCLIVVITMIAGISSKDYFIFIRISGILNAAFIPSIDDLIGFSRN